MDVEVGLDSIMMGHTYSLIPTQCRGPPAGRRPKPSLMPDENTPVADMTGPLLENMRRDQCVSYLSSSQSVSNALARSICDTRLEHQVPAE